MGNVRRSGRPALDDGKTEMRTCARHGLAPHRLYGRKQPRWTCRHCISAAVTKRHRKVRAELVAGAGGRCATCGYDRCMLNLHFHHVDPSTKSFALTVARGKSLAAYTAEAAKCVLLCANCHGEVEAGLVASPPAGATWADLHPGSS